MIWPLALSSITFSIILSLVYPITQFDQLAIPQIFHKYLKHAPTSRTPPSLYHLPRMPFPYTGTQVPIQMSPPSRENVLNLSILNGMYIHLNCSLSSYPYYFSTARVANDTMLFCLFIAWAHNRFKMHESMDCLGFLWTHNAYSNPNIWYVEALHMLVFLTSI